MCTISVCLAAYNGEAYIEEQIKSILIELSSKDTLYIADDCSTDSTLSVISKIQDKRIKVIKNEKNIGYIRNFNMLLDIANTDYIFFSDQDDVWVKGRVKLMIDSSKVSQKNVIFGRFSLIDRAPLINRNTQTIKYNNSYIKNIVRLFFGWKEFTYFGSTLMITRKAKDYLFPMVSSEVGHDIWVALLANLKKDIFHLDEVVTKRRLHENNLTKNNRNALDKIITRLIWLKSLYIYANKKY